LFDLGVFEEELVLKPERRIIPHRFPRSVTVLPDSDHEVSVVVNVPVAVPIRRPLDVLDGDGPLVDVGSPVEI
jgi:hypothetical protein